MKQTEVGLIPDDWEVKEIKDFADVTTGDKNTQDAEENGKYPFYVRSPIVERINKFSYDTEGVITAGDGVGTGKVFHYAKGKFGLHQRAYLIYNFKNTDPKYFYYNFSKNFYERVHSMTAKSSVDSVRREMITKMQIPIPPTLAEQQRIAKALSDVDALISTTEKLIQKKKNIKQGAMQNLLTGKKRLPGFGSQTNPPTYKQTELGPIPEDWEVKSLGESFDIGSSKRVFQSQWRKSGIPFYRAREIVILAEKNTVENELFIDETLYNQYKTLYGVPAVNDLLVTGVGTLGKVYKVQNTNPFYYKDGNIICLKNKGAINSDYVRYHFDYYIVKNQINDNSGKSTVGTYTINSARKTIIPVPSLPEQTAIANVLSSMDKEIETLNTKLEKYRNLKTAMMQQLLTGKIRLVK